MKTAAVKSSDDGFVYYFFAHTLDLKHLSKEYSRQHHVQKQVPEFIKTHAMLIRAGESWEVTRYRLEKKYHMDRPESTRRDRKLRKSFFTGYHLWDWVCYKGASRPLLNYQFVDFQILVPGMVIVLHRKPLPKGFDFFIPTQIQLQEQHRKTNMTTMMPSLSPKTDQSQTKYQQGNVVGAAASNAVTEAAFVKDDDVSEKTTKMQYHASIFDTDRMPKPDPLCRYRCVKCWRVGHFRQYCQGIESIPTFFCNRRDIAAMDDRHSKRLLVLPLPPGIPMTHFEKVPAEMIEGEGHIAIAKYFDVCVLYYGRDATNQLYIRKK